MERAQLDAYALALHDALPVSVESLLERRDDERDVTVAVVLEPGELRTRIGPFEAEIAGDLSLEGADPRSRSETHTSKHQTRSDFLFRRLYGNKKSTVPHGLTD